MAWMIFLSIRVFLRQSDFHARTLEESDIGASRDFQGCKRRNCVLFIDWWDTEAFGLLSKGPVAPFVRRRRGSLEEFWVTAFPQAHCNIDWKCLTSYRRAFSRFDSNVRGCTARRMILTDLGESMSLLVLSLKERRLRGYPRILHHILVPACRPRWYLNQSVLR